ncbi:Hypothetical protein PENO1_038070 [Penicillium occitanis (nom. inval.)]|nr:Hypothetical protein PENO1_038070 [Penicillium occitanis (nom. inval.)]PCH03251.1 hypothetical protein PENOC_039450 [Penicillium occitanis (nom. inval.)]
MFLNGVAKAESSHHHKHEIQLATVLIAASGLGAVWKVDPNTGDYKKAISFPEMLPPTNASLDIGINGIAVYDGSLYWTNTASETIYAVHIDSSTCSALPNTSVRTVAEDIGIAIDDFTFDNNGNLYVAGGDTAVVFMDAADPSKSNLGPKTVVGSTTSMTVAGMEAGKIVAIQCLDV